MRWGGKIALEEMLTGSAGALCGDDSAPAAHSIYDRRFTTFDLARKKGGELGLEGFDLFFDLESATELVGGDVECVHWGQE
jgi:hypothetical protein